MSLVGTCNQCGLCCLITTPDGEKLRCINLVVIGALSQPMATHCAIYPIRKDGTPILLLDNKGKIRGHSTCAIDSPDEFNAIVENLDKGCSLTLTGG